MIGEPGGVAVQINSERVGRETSVQSDRLQQEKEPEVEQQQEFSDVTSFSAEALALSRNVTAASGNAEQQGAEPGGQTPQQAQTVAYKPIDLMA